MRGMAGLLGITTRSNTAMVTGKKATMRARMAISSVSSLLPFSSFGAGKMRNMMNAGR